MFLTTHRPLSRGCTVGEEHHHRHNSSIDESPSWAEALAHRNSENTDRYKAFLHANKWQRENAQLRTSVLDGFLFLVGLFHLFLLEQLWSSDLTAFKTSRNGDVFLFLLVIGAGCGSFTIFSMTMVKIKVQRMLVRDNAALNSRWTKELEVAGSRLDRLVRRWERPLSPSRHQSACLLHEWYHGTGTARRGRFRSWNPTRPVVLMWYAGLSLAVMIVSSAAAVVVRIADAESVEWVVFSCIVFASGTVLPVLFVYASTCAPEIGDAFGGFF